MIGLWWFCLVLGDAWRPPECQMYVWHVLNRAAGCPKSLPYLQMCKRHKEFMWKLDQEPTWPNHTLTRVTRTKSVQSFSLSWQPYGLEAASAWNLESFMFFEASQDLSWLMLAALLVSAQKNPSDSVTRKEMHWKVCPNSRDFKT